jgi:glycine oxidase
LALLTDARRLGAHVVTDHVVRIDRDGERVTGVSGHAARYAANEVVIAAGAWSGQIEGLPRPLRVQPVRGQMAALPWPASIPRTIIYSKDCYLLARGGEAIIGSTMEHVGFKPEVTAGGLAQVIAATMLLYPGLARAKVRRSWAGLRPITPDGLPIIGADPLLRGLWYATGYGRNGILLAGFVGVLLRQLMDGETPAMDVRAFAPDRF